MMDGFCLARNLKTEFQGAEEMAWQVKTLPQKHEYLSLDPCTVMVVCVYDPITWETGTRESLKLSGQPFYPNWQVWGSVRDLLSKNRAEIS